MPNSQKHNEREWMPWLIVFFFSITFVCLAGIGEALRVYPVFRLETGAAKTQVLLNQIQSNLDLGSPIKYSGNYKLIETALETNPGITAIGLLNPSIDTFFTYQKEFFKRPSQQAIGVESLEITLPFKKEQTENVNFIKKGLQPFYISGILFEKPLTSVKHKSQNIETLILIEFEKGYLVSDIWDHLKKLYWLPILLLFAFIITLKIGFDSFPKIQKSIFSISFASLFFILALFLIFSLSDLYRKGIENKSLHLIESLEKRLKIPVSLGINIQDELSGFDSLLFQTIKNDANLSKLALISNQSDTLAKASGIEFKENYPDKKILNSRLCCRTHNLKEDSTLYDFKLAWEIPQKVINDKLKPAIRNLFFLFLACAFLSWILIELFRTIFFRNNKHILHPQIVAQKAGRALFTLGVFGETLALSFLPSYLNELLIHSSFQFPVSLFFVLYFAGFALVIIPAGRYAERGKVSRFAFIGFHFFAVLVYPFYLHLIGFYFLLWEGLSQALGKACYLLVFSHYY